MIGGSSSLEDVLERAVAAGHITAAQAATILDEERRREPSTQRLPPRVSPALEAFGYLGAVFVIVGAMSLASESWHDAGTAGQLGLLGSTSLILTAAGLAIHDEGEPVLWRLRGVLHLLGSGAVAGFSTILSSDAIGAEDEWPAMVVGLVIALYAGTLWRRQDRPALHLACFVGVLTFTAALFTRLSHNAVIVGLALWLLGAAWAVAARKDFVPSRSLGLGLGGILALISAGITAFEWHHVGVLFALATALALLAIGIRVDDFGETALGVIGAFVYLPATIAIFFGEAAGVPIVLLFSGIALLALMVVLVRSREAKRTI